MKPKLVLTGRWWPNPWDEYSDHPWFIEGIVCLGKDMSYRGMHDFLVIGGRCYEYSVQYRMEAQNNS